MLIHNKDDNAFGNEFPCLLGYPVNGQYQWTHININKLTYRVAQKKIGIQWRIRYRLCYELALLYLISKDIKLLCLPEFIKGTVSVVSNDPQHAKMAMLDSQRCRPFKACMISYELDIIFYNLKNDYFQLWFIYHIHLRISTAGII